MIRTCPRCQTNSLEVLKTHSICYECNLNSEDWMADSLLGGNLSDKNNFKADLKTKSYYYPMNLGLQKNIKESTDLLNSLSEESSNLKEDKDDLTSFEENPLGPSLEKVVP